MSALALGAVVTSASLWAHTAYRALKRRAARPKVAFVDSRRSRAV